MTDDVEQAFRRWIKPGATVALADGVGMPVGLCAALSSVAREVGGVKLILGWCPELPATLDLDAFVDVRAFMPGRALRDGVASGAVRYVPAYLSQLPSLFATTWRPDLLVMAVRETSNGLRLGSEVSWINVAAQLSVACIAELNNALPDAAQQHILHGVEVKVVSESVRAPMLVQERGVDSVFAEIGSRVAKYVMPGAAVQFGPGPLGESFLAALDVPVKVDTGIATDSLVDLDARGLLLGDPIATYLAGTEKLYEWANGRALLDGVETTHRYGRLDTVDLVAVNGALQIDLIGQVGVDGGDSTQVAGIGGYVDYASAAARSTKGVSIVAVPSTRRGASTLVERLTVPVSVQRSIVDIVVTERGSADLRGRSDSERAKLIGSLFEAVG
jgi:acyl-CoA hydrolase